MISVQTDSIGEKKRGARKAAPLRLRKMDGTVGYQVWMVRSYDEIHGRTDRQSSAVGFFFCRGIQSFVCCDLFGQRELLATTTTRMPQTKPAAVIGAPLTVAAVRAWMLLGSFIGHQCVSLPGQKFLLSESEANSSHPEFPDGNYLTIYTEQGALLATLCEMLPRILR